jgi:oligoribonuclease
MTELLLEEFEGDVAPEMLWIDLETTGLEANLDVPLEVGMAITDRWGNVKSSAKRLVWETGVDFQRGVVRGHDNEIVNAMHKQSGLWDDLNAFDTMDRQNAEDFFCGWLDSQEIPAGKLPMCGNSIGSLDRPFVQQHFPKLNNHFHYRNIDISSFKEVCKMVNPDLYKNLEPIIGTKADATHRVLGDVAASIREYRAYLDNFLFVAEE